MATNEVKKQCRRREGKKAVNMDVDRISNHLILSFLPPFDAVRMSILCKRWRRMWIYIPVLYFKQLKEDVLSQEMAKLKENEFLEFMKKKLDEWPSNAVEEGNVKELVLCIKPIALTLQPRNIATWHYSLPRTVVDSRTLVILKLKDVKLKAHFS
ncbi:hypothetical protein FEM48_ZijujUnG0096100 [Ziziphus jujuba var. spinosa]|uniref:F-box domain-containing protein n=1 Tax=Ziziphus jujuba var. spinosa TaxID=714518 RepID=A0A978U8E8_ZIZJJ|nr:hypothetical protein FEM48_ZijujUnG0096100 [Ziziphus jujuba var. spinosa]